MKIRVLTLNCHKGFTTFNRRFVLDELRAAIRKVDAHLVFLQEVHGEQPKNALTENLDGFESQVEYLADQIWSEFAYGRNSVYQNGHHGNAILSKFPISRSENTDLSVNPLERRGLLYGRVDIPTSTGSFALDCFSVHLNLLSLHRKQQWDIIHRQILRLSSASNAAILAGDFNDWTKSLHFRVRNDADFYEAYEEKFRTLAKTYPSMFPILSLDRVYVRILKLLNCQVLKGAPWNGLSDHLPILCEFALE